MNTTYKILWIEDSEDFYDTTEGLISEIVQDNSMVPQIKYYSQYQQYQAEELVSFDAEIFNQYDQLIIDYALSGITGDQVIRELRERQIYTDIVFYSSEFQKMQDELKNGVPLDGVFLADRDDLTRIVNNVIKKNIRREYNIANVRGLIMDSSSEFDYICRITAVDLFEKLSDPKKDEIIQKAIMFVTEAEKQSSQNFEKLKKKHGKSFINEAMNSVEYVMSNKNRYEIMALILKEYEFAQSIPGSFVDDYESNVIKPRNKLAHAKLYYGECKKRIHIAKKRQVMKCNQNCENCGSAYDIDSCEELRRKLFEYYTLFTKIDSDTNKCLEPEPQLVHV